MDGGVTTLYLEVRRGREGGRKDFRSKGGRWGGVGEGQAASKKMEEVITQERERERERERGQCSEYDRKEREGGRSYMYWGFHQEAQSESRQADYT